MRLQSSLIVEHNNKYSSLHKQNFDHVSGQLNNLGFNPDRIIQKITDFLGNLRSVEVNSLTAQAAVDSVPVATIGACKWFVHVFEEATPANREAFEIFAINDGTNADFNEVSKLKLGSTGGNFVNASVDVSGGNMRLLLVSNTAGLTCRVRRVAVEDV